MKSVRCNRYAMATFWEIQLWGDDPQYLESAGNEALREITRIEDQLSFYREHSEVSDLNRRASYEPVPVDPRLFRLLERARECSDAMEGAFDPTVAPLLRCWGFVNNTGKVPDDAEITFALSKVGMSHILLDAAAMTVQFDREGVLIDFGAIGKGYAVECAAEILRDLAVASALIHGGTSSVFAIGSPPDQPAWRIALQNPVGEGKDDFLGYVNLMDQALSVSAPHGKWFEVDGKRYGHVIDPRSGRPTSWSLLAAVVTDSGTDSDALSTGLLTLGADGLERLKAFRPKASGLILSEGDGEGPPLLESNGSAFEFVSN